VIAMATPSFSTAALVSGHTAYDATPAYSVRSQDLTYDVGGAQYSNLPVLLICIDHATDPPFDITSHFETEAGASAIKGPSGVAGEAAIYWLLDQYYMSYYKNGSKEQQRALQFALWEIGNDYNGTADSINSTQGSSRPINDDAAVYYGGDQATFTSAYEVLYAAMKANLPSLRTTYRSSKYTMDLFRNADPQYQNMVALIEKEPPNTAPLAEPSITGTPRVGDSLTGSYTYADNDFDIEDPNGTTYHFVTSPNPSITNSSDGTVVASGSTGGADKTVPYTVRPSDLNQYVYFCVKPAAQTGVTPGSEVCSIASGPVSASVSPSSPTPVPFLGMLGLTSLSALVAMFGLARSRRRPS